MSSSRDYTQIPDCVTRDGIRPLLEAQLASYKKKADEANILNKKSFLSYIDDCYTRRQKVSTKMVAATTAALSCLDGNTTNLSEVVNARAKVSEYREDHPASVFQQADKLLFQASLFAEYPEEDQVYVTEESRYPGMFFDTSGRTLNMQMQPADWRKKALQDGILESRAYTGKSAAIEAEIYGSQGGASVGGSSKADTADGNEEQNTSSEQSKQPWKTDPNWWLK